MDRKQLGAWLSRYTEWDVLVAYRSDRLSRGTQEDWTAIEHWAAEHGKVLCLVDGSTGVRYPARDDSDYWQWTAEKRRASREWDEIRERNIRSQTALQSTGAFLGRPPFGYQITGPRYGKRLEVDEAKRYLIEGVFERAIAGVGIRGILAWLRSEGVDASQRLVLAIIGNWAYAGRLERNGVHYMDCPAIVDAGTLLKAQRAMRSRTRKAVGGRPSQEPALLVPRCAEHDRPMYRGGEGDRYFCIGHFSAPCDAVDAAVKRIVFGSEEPERRLIIVPGRDWAADIETVRRDRQQALERDDLDAVGELTRRLKELQARPVEPERAEWEPTGRTVGKAMAALPRDELRQVLRGWEVIARADGGLTLKSPWAPKGSRN
jgi:hypothetical protein